MAAGTKLLLIRHASAAGQAPDDDLSADGHNQAAALADTLGNFAIDGLFSSPYRRARATIAPFAARSGLAVTILDNLRERRGAAMPATDWHVHMRRSFADFDHALAGGESMNDARRRALEAVASVAATGLARPAAVSHGNLIASLLSAVDDAFGLEQWRVMRNPDLFEVDIVGGLPTAYRRLG